MRDLFVKNLGLKLLSILFAISLWLFVNLKATEERDLQLPLRWEHLPSFLEITNPVNDFVRIRVTGPRRILSNLNPGKFPVILDLTDAKAGLMDYQITEKMISLIPGLRVEVLPPDKVQFKFDLIVTKEVSVEPDIVGKPPVGYTLEKVEVAPERIEVVGAQSEIIGIDQAGTRSIDVSELRGSLEKDVSVVLDRPHVWPAEGQEKVRVRLFVQEKEIGKWLRNVRVRVEDPGRPFTVHPTHVDIYLKGPAGAVHALSPEGAHAFVRFPEGEGKIFALPVELRPLSEDLHTEIRPAKVVLKILPRNP